jgi:hypothetical protein
MVASINASTSAGVVTTADTSGILQLQTASTAAVTIDASQNVGIGTSTMTRNLNVGGSGAAVGLSLQNSGTSGRSYSIFSTNAGASVVGALGIYDDTAGAYRMTINSSGNLLVGTTSAPSVTSTSLANYGLGFNNDYSGGNAIVINSTSTSSNQYYIGFGRGSAQAGYILSSTTNSTTYSTSSDYRLKNDITPMSNALSKVALLKPCTWKWKLDSTSSQGFIAHELSEVIPEAVAGTKDEVDADGNPRYQGVDTSFVVATLTAAIQELKAINDTQAETINALTARVVALESK